MLWYLGAKVCVIQGAKVCVIQMKILPYFQYFYLFLSDMVRCWRCGLQDSVFANFSSLLCYMFDALPANLLLCYCCSLPYS